MNKKIKKALHKAGAMTMALLLGSSGVVQGTMSVYAATSLSGAYEIAKDKDTKKAWQDTDKNGDEETHRFSSYEPGTKSIQVDADYAHRIETTKKTKYTVEAGKRVGIGKTVGPTGEDKDTMVDTESKPLFRVSENTAGSMAVKISDCEIWQCDADGSNAHKVKVDVVKTITNFKQNAEGDIDGQKDGYIHFSTGLNGVSYMDNVEEVTMKTEFYKAGTNEKVSLKSNITLSDIDNSQYVSVNSKIMSGEYVASATNLLYNKDGNYDVYSSKAGNDTSGVKSAVGFIFETNTFMYTFGKDVKQPTGNVQYVASSSQSMVSFKPTKPIKTVSDVDKDNTPETDVTTNHLPDLAKSWLYKVTQPIVTNTAEKDYYDSFVMSDTLDSCLTLEKTPVVENQEGSDVSNLFNIKVEGTKVTATAKNTKDKGFYENSSYVLKIQAKVAGVKAGMSEEENKALIEKLKAHGHYNETQTTLHYENKEETIIDGEVYPSNKVDTIIELPKPNEDGKEPGLKITKDVNRYEHQVNDIVKYTVTVKNANPKADTAYFVIKDTTLPDTMALDFSSVKVSGIDSENYTLTQSGNGWILASKGDYALPQSATIKITYDAKALVASNGTCVDNTASTYAAGIPTKEDKEQVYINSPKVDVVKEAPDRNYKVGDTVGYKVTITNRNAGTFMRDIVMNDLVKTKGLEIKEGTVAVLVNGEDVTQYLDVVYNDDGTGFTIKTPYNLKNGTNPYLDVSSYALVAVNNWVDKIVVTYDATITNEAALETDLKNIFDVPSTKNTNDELIREDDSIPSGGGSSEEDVKMKAPALDIEKKSNKQEYKVGDIGKYTLTVKQTKEETTAKNVVVKDAFAEKDGLEINKDSLVVKMNGEDITKDCEIKAEATSFTILT
ncbi:MAG: isopeptide-forming domain-containing fimbrial protein, partial [Anaerostipes sp.]|nr:isopeptide-forming domain-containing fimbrial protein [Anaerostipes sp.]